MQESFTGGVDKLGWLWLEMGSQLAHPYPNSPALSLPQFVHAEACNAFATESHKHYTSDNTVHWGYIIVATGTLIDSDQHQTWQTPFFAVCTERQALMQVLLIVMPECPEALLAPHTLAHEGLDEWHSAQMTGITSCS